jgi:hypothetical protein
MRVRYLLTATWSLSLLVAAPFHAQALEDRPVPPLPIPNVANTTVHPSAVSSPPQSRLRPRDHAQRTAAPPAGEKSAIKAGQASALKSGEASDLSLQSAIVVPTFIGTGAGPLPGEARARERLETVEPVWPKCNPRVYRRALGSRRLA